MQYLIKKAKIHSAGSQLDGKTMDILVTDGVIEKIDENISASEATLIESEELNVSIGWMDIGTHLGEPGNEHRETMQSLCGAALAGGFTDIAPFPTANPTIQTKAQITSLIHTGKEYGVTIRPIGTLSIDGKGEQIAEYLDMTNAGAVAISDGLASIQKSGLLLRALQYAKSNNSLIIHHPTDESLDNATGVHEGETSLRMGLKGSPELAEYLMVDRDIQLLDYTASRLCLHAISSAGSIQRIEDAEEVNLHASVAYMNLIHTSSDMLDFDSNMKVTPVLRDDESREALVEAVKNETIDYICTNHVPLEEEAKKLEFPYADAGATGLETMYAALRTHDILPDADIIRAVTTGPREVLKMATPTIEEGARAVLTLWDPSQEWTYESKHKKSKSANNPYLGKKLKGKVVATINGKHSYIS